MRIFLGYLVGFFFTRRGINYGTEMEGELCKFQGWNPSWHYKRVFFSPHHFSTFDVGLVSVPWLRVKSLRI